jgi:diguanylate cyclase (GGDEF)-like protein/PAS domain S-box-containing protein
MHLIRLLQSLSEKARLKLIKNSADPEGPLNITELSSSESRFRNLFEYAPISIWEEDFSAVREYIELLGQPNVDALSAYFEANPHEILECAKRVKIIDINRATLEIFQAESKEYLLSSLLNVFGTESMYPFKEQLIGLLRGEMFFENETVNYTLSGQKRLMSMRLTIPPEYSKTWARVFVVMTDITKRGQTEEALRQSEERFKLLAWATKDAVWDWDLRTNQIWWGEGLQKIFHYSLETTETTTDWWFEHIHPEDLHKVKHTIKQALEVGLEFWSKEYRFQRKDGTYADIMDRGYILRDNTGAPYRMIGAMLDITDRKYMESALRKTNDQMKQFLEELQRRNIEIGLLNEMGRLLQACQSLDDAYRIIGELSKELFPKTSGALYLFNKSRSHVSSVSSWGNLSSDEQIISPNDCWALHGGKTRPLKEPGSTLSCRHLPEQFSGISYCLPLQIQGEILGILHVRSYEERDFDESKRQLIYSVAEHATMALSNLNLRTALREQSIRDPLTGLYNRRYMEEFLKEYMTNVTKREHPLAIIMIDIDHFKNFNDIHGHAGGDSLLRELAQFLQSHIRGEDIACRYGGEEFILILPGIPLHLAQRRAEQLRQEARLLRLIDIDKFNNGITLSLGVSTYPLHGRGIDSILRAADMALYYAKKQGRNQVAIAEIVTEPNS